MNERGVTLLETLIAAVVAIVLLMALAGFIRGIGVLAGKGFKKDRAQTMLNKALFVLERDFVEMNQVWYSTAPISDDPTIGGRLPEMPVDEALPTPRFMFLMDSHRHPQYDPDRMIGVSIDGEAWNVVAVPARWHPDDDGDRIIIAPNPWRVGNDRDDDDEYGRDTASWNPNPAPPPTTRPRGDERRDVMCLYTYDPAAGTLYREFSYDQGPWQARELVLDRITHWHVAARGALNHTFQSSARAALGRSFRGVSEPLDDPAINAGAPAEGLGDRVITAAEIDNWTEKEFIPGQAPNDLIDDFLETEYIVALRVILGVDADGDCREKKIPPAEWQDKCEDARLVTWIEPPLMAVKEKHPQ